MRLSPTSVHMSQLEHSHVNLQREQASALTQAQASLRETFTQERALLQTQHEAKLCRVKQLDQEQQERQKDLHRCEMGECSRACYSLFYFFLA